MGAQAGTSTESEWREERRDAGEERTETSDKEQDNMRSKELDRWERSLVLFFFFLASLTLSGGCNARHAAEGC